MTYETAEDITTTEVEGFGWVDDLAAAARRHHVAVTLTFTPLDDTEEGP